MGRSYCLYLFLTLLLITLVRQDLSASPESSLLEIDSFLKEHYYDQKFIESDWPKVLKSAKQSMAKAKDEQGAYSSIQEALRAFGHSHMSFYPPWRTLGLQSSGRHGGLDMDFDVHLIENKIVVGKVRVGGASERGGLKSGMKLLSIDGTSSEEILSKAAPLYEVYRLIDQCPWGKLNLLVEGRSRPRRRGMELSIQLKIDDGPKSRFGHVSFPRRVVIERRKDEILYASFNAFTFDQVREVKEGIQKNRDSRGVILDLRGNQGGVGALGPAIALEFSKKAYSFGSMKGREIDLRFPVFPQPSVHPGPVVILVDGRSLSTSEIMARGMQLEGEAVVIGEKTPGMALPSLILRLKDGSRFQYPIADFKDEAGSRLEGQGVTPDYEVSNTMDDINDQRDAILTKAVNWIIENSDD